MTVTNFVLFVVAIGLSLVQAKLSERKAKKKPLDDTPAITARRGSWIPRVIGKRRIGHVVGAVWGRDSRREKQGKRTAFAARPKVRYYLEDAMHLLAVGPLDGLFEIESGGKVLTEWPIYRDTFPSGSRVDLGGEGAFYMYWGENDQPVNTRLGDADAVGIESRWPGIAYIEWSKRKLGTSARWEAHTYVVDGAVGESHLSNTDERLPASSSSESYPWATSPVRAFNGVEGVGKFLVSPWLALAVGSSSFRLTDAFYFGAGIPDQNFDIYATATETHARPGDGLMVTYTAVYPVGGLSGFDEGVSFYGRTVHDDDTTGVTYYNPFIRFFKPGGGEGVNPAHMIADLLFSQAPHGLARDKDKFDMDALEDLGTLLAAEGIQGSFIAQDGVDAQAWLGMVLQDLGVLMPIDPTTGKITFVAVREPTGTVTTITSDMQVGLAQPDVNHGGRTYDKLAFNFQDAENRFRDSVLAVDDDGSVRQSKYAKAQEVQITVTTDHDTASAITERRTAEELGDPSSLTVVATRAARRLLPGTPIYVEGFSVRQRILSVAPSADSENATLELVKDFYALPATQYIAGRGDPGRTGQGEPAGPDIAFTIFEVPEALQPGEPMTVSCLRVRAADQNALIHVSEDDVTYLDPEEDTSVMTGGALLEALPDDGLFYQAEGPTFQLGGPDADSALDLSGDLAAWRAGRQKCVVGGELMLLQKITQISQDTYRLDGLLRARADTRREDHSVGDYVFIFQDDDAIGIQDNPPVTPGATIYMKSQPFNAGGLVAPFIDAQSLVLYGKGTRPVPVSQIALDLASHGERLSYADNSLDLDIVWDYSTPRTASSGAGNYNAGEVQLTIDPEGLFLVEILTTSDVVVRTVSASTASYTYLQADRVADGLSNASFKVRVTQQRTGQSSDPTVQQITKT